MTTTAEVAATGEDMGVDMEEEELMEVEAAMEGMIGESRICIFTPGQMSFTCNIHPMAGIGR